jgi:arabinan endo-1,5-alpha-L-arabinosidase
MTEGLTRRTVWSGALAAGTIAGLSGCSGARLDTAGQGEPVPLDLSGNLTPVHDPAIIRADGVYHLFSTSHMNEEPGLLHWRTSTDLQTWSMHGAVFQDMPEWARRDYPESRGLWAPDIVSVGDEHRIYYSVSTFGENDSAIGMAVARDLSAADPWVDRGPVIRSTSQNDYNAIDPAVFTGADGRMWMAFGSFWSGLKIFELDPATGMALEEEPRLHSIARRPSPGAVEAPFIIERDGWHYLFASFGLCCRGEESTYRTVVGRSRQAIGPYLDREGADMMDGGGTVILQASDDPAGRFVGPGHCAVLRDPEQDYLVHHAYDLRAEATPTLRIRPIAWRDGWPVVT